MIKPRDPQLASVEQHIFWQTSTAGKMKLNILEKTTSGFTTFYTVVIDQTGKHGVTSVEVFLRLALLHCLSAHNEIQGEAFQRRLPCPTGLLIVPAGKIQKIQAVQIRYATNHQTLIFM